MSAPQAPGGVSRPRLTGSATTTRRAPASWAMSAIARTSSSEPKKFGYWITTAALCLDRAFRSASRSVIPSPSGTDLILSPGPST